MVIADLTEVEAPSTRAGDAALCHELHQARRMQDWGRELRSVAQRLAFLDEAPSHDTELDAQRLSELGFDKIDYVDEAIQHACWKCNSSLLDLRDAHACLVGLSRGQVKDDTEEMLARTIKLLTARVENLRATKQEYQAPRRPFEIRRNSLTYLIISSAKVENELAQIIEHCDDATVSKDFIEGLQLCLTQFQELIAQLKSLRERSSQKMAPELAQYAAMFLVIRNRFKAIVHEAGERGRCQHWYSLGKNLIERGIMIDD